MADRLAAEVDRLLDSRPRAWLAQETGISPSTLSRMLHGQVPLTAARVAAIAAALEVDPRYLLAAAGIPIPGTPADHDPRLGPLMQRVAAAIGALPAPDQELFVAQLSALADLAERLTDPPP